MGARKFQSPVPFDPALLHDAPTGRDHELEYPIDGDLSVVFTPNLNLSLSPSWGPDLSWRWAFVTSSPKQR